MTLAADREAMLAEAQAIAATHPAILSSVSSYWDGQRIAPLHPVPAVVVDLPGDISCRGVEILVRHVDGAVLVDVREKPSHAWVPIGHVGGSFEVRS